MDICPAIPTSAGFISSTTGYIDCQAQLLGSGAWTALAAPGSTVTVVLTGFLTIFIGLIGYNLLLGQSLTVRSGTLAFVKIGAIFALATSWPAYRTVIYDLVTDGPSQLVAEIGPEAGVVGSDGTLVQRLDLVDHALTQLAILGPGSPPANANAQVAPEPFGGFDAFALGGSKILFELAAVAGLGIVRIITGLMLSLGPFFIAFLMFENTRSLFEGWVRVLGGAALAAIGVSIALGLELAFIEPWLANVLARRMAGEPLPSVSTELFVIAVIFAMLVTASLYACAQVVRAFQLAPLMRIHSFVMERTTHRTGASSAFVSKSPRETAAVDHSRAAALAAVLTASAHRDRRQAVIEAMKAPAPAERTRSRAGSNELVRTAVPVGRSFTRRPQARTSALATRRDTGA
jgi:type IV secretion system protein VirB6